MTKKSQKNLFWRLLALGGIFAVSTSIAIASPYRHAFLLPGGGYGWSAQAPVYVGMPQQAVPMQAAPNYTQYNAAYSPAVPTNINQGAADYLQSVTVQGTYRWQAASLPIKIYVADGSGVPGYRPQFKDMIHNCFDQWCQASGNKLSWVPVDSAQKADITVNWTVQPHQRAEGTEAGKTDAYTKLNTQTGEGIIYGAKMQILTMLNGKPFNDLEINKTLLHETGHALGLQGHSPNRNDIMYYAINPTQQPVLNNRDANTMAELYQSYPTPDALALHRTK